MRTAPASIMVLFFLATTLGLAACEPKEADTSTTPLPEAAQDSADEWFVSKHGFRIPLKDKAEFLACAEEIENDGWGWARLDNGVWRPGHGNAYSIGGGCVPREAIPLEGLGFCEDPRSPVLNYCPDAPPGTPFIVIGPPSPTATRDDEALK